jgi:hypothetical protein
MAELARVLPALDVVNEIKRTCPGALITSGPYTAECDATDWATSDPVRAAIEMNPERPSSRRQSKNNGTTTA